jgi:hypothetical protein
MYCSLFGTHVPWSPEKLTVVVTVNKWPQLSRSSLRREILHKRGSLHCQHSSVYSSILFLGLNSDSTLEYLSFQQNHRKTRVTKISTPFLLCFSSNFLVLNPQEHLYVGLQAPQQNLVIHCITHLPAVHKLSIEHISCV